jgi:hypothetical protein
MSIVLPSSVISVFSIVTGLPEALVMAHTMVRSTIHYEMAANAFLEEGKIVSHL